MIVALDLLKAGNMYPLLAVVGFVFAGSIMDAGGMASQIVEIAKAIIGGIRGGLGIVTILGCMFFAAMIGSGPGAVAAMGCIMIPTMIREGYSPAYATGVTATGGTLGILIPPSNPMIIYGVIANVSITSLFMAGFIPGIVVGLVLMITAYTYARRAGFKLSRQEPFSMLHLLKMLRQGIFSLLAPVIILGSIYTGFATPVEASVLAVVYALFVGVFITKKIDFASFWESVQLARVTAGTILIVVGVSFMFGRFVTLCQIPQQMATWLLGFTADPFYILLIILILLFILGMFMETLATIVILVPVFLPIVLQVGIDPIYLGIIWVMTNELAMLTPPLGVNLFVAMNIANTSLEETAMGALPYVVALFATAVFFIRFGESIVLFLPNLLR
jgi:C4-dicarboxylate transporter DctM subunit